MHRSYLDTPQGQIHYADEGVGEVLLLLHHTPRSSEVFRPVFPLLRERGRIVAPDFPGMGASDPPALDTVEGIAERMMQFVDLLGIETFSVFGMNTGAAVAIAMASECPMRVSRLGLLAVPLVLDEEVRQGALASIPSGTMLSTSGEELLQYWNYYGPNRWAWELQHRPNGSDDADGTAFGAKYLADILRALDSFNSGRVAAFSYRAGPRLGMIAAPTLVLRPALEGDPTNGTPDFLRMSREVATRIPGSVLREIPGANSITSMSMDPVLMAGILADFFFADPAAGAS